jgi:thymidine kinase
MYSEKTTELLSRTRRANLAMFPVVLVKYEGDDRYHSGAAITTHAAGVRGAEVATATMAATRVVVVRRLGDVALAPNELVVGVDEGQFYPDLAAVCRRWKAEGRRVIVAALDGDYKQEMFQPVAQLLPHCEYIEKRRGICMACRSADSAFTHRTTAETAQEVIGSKDKYTALCAACLATASTSADG